MMNESSSISYEQLTNLIPKIDKQNRVIYLIVGGLLVLALVGFCMYSIYK